MECKSAAAHGEPTGLILSVQRLSTEDGPGIRSTVFFKSCPLSCRWCQNPESISPRPELQWHAPRCLGCRSCVQACPLGCVELRSDGIHIDRGTCDACGACAEACPSGALEMLGRRVGAAELAAELSRDAAWYEESGGGVTLSGGEPLAQPSFAAAVLDELHRKGIPAALDTCGMASPQAFSSALSKVDVVLYDLKLADPARHQELTGQPNDVILSNLERAAEAVAARSGGLSLWVRTPLVPGATATRDNIMAIGNLIAKRLDSAAARWELCAFNNLCRDKYRRLGRTWDYADAPLLRRAELEEAAGWARDSGVDPEIVFLTGASRFEGDL